MAEQALTGPRLERAATESARVEDRRRARTALTLLPLLPIAVFLLLVTAGALSGRDASQQDLLNRLLPPLGAGGSWSHPLGTDSLGRDLLARVLDAMWRSLLIGVVAATLAAIVGVGLGIAGGTLGGWQDRLITAAAEICLSVPTIVIGIVLTATLGQSLVNLVVILVISGWVGYARVLRLRLRSLVHAEFIVAARTLGASPLRVVWRHLVPNVLPTVIVLVFQQVAAVMVWEASLTYLGLGMPVADVTLGGLVREGQDHVFTAWWLGVVPGVLIALAVIGFNLAADWLQLRLDPVLGRSRLPVTRA